MSSRRWLSVSPCPEKLTAETDTWQSARGYYDCAAWRFVDCVILSGPNSLFMELAEGLSSVIIEELGLKNADANERCLELLAIEPHIEAQRQRLQGEVTALEQAKAKIDELLQENKSGLANAKDALVNGDSGDVIMAGM